MSHTMPDTYKGWIISWDYGYYEATSSNYDANWEGEETGWVDNGERVSARTLSDLYKEIDAFIESIKNEPSRATAPVC